MPGFFQLGNSRGVLFLRWDLQTLRPVIFCLAAGGGPGGLPESLRGVVDPLSTWNALLAAGCHGVRLPRPLRGNQLVYRKSTIKNLMLYLASTSAMRTIRYRDSLSEVDGLSDSRLR